MIRIREYFHVGPLIFTAIDGNGRRYIHVWNTSDGAVMVERYDGMNSRRIGKWKVKKVK